jgi:flagellar biogenesis protein FliO
MRSLISICIALSVLSASSIAAQAPSGGNESGGPTRRPAGRRLLDEAARERGTDRSAARTNAPDESTVDERPDEVPAAPANEVVDQGRYPAVSNAPRGESANYPFDAPQSDKPSPATTSRYGAYSPPSALADGEQAPGRDENHSVDARLEAGPATPHFPEIDAPGESRTAARAVGDVQPAAYHEPITAADDGTSEAVDAPVIVADPTLMPPPVEEQAPCDEAISLDRQSSGSEQLATRSKAAASPLTTMLGSLALVLALFFVLVWVMRRAMPAGSRQLPSDVIEILGRAPLPGKQQQMQLVRCGQKLLLLASSASGVTTLTEITDEDEVDRLTRLCRGELPMNEPVSFRRTLDDLARESNSRGFADAGVESAAAALSRRMGRTSRLEASDA